MGRMQGEHREDAVVQPHRLHPWALKSHSTQLDSSIHPFLLLLGFRNSAVPVPGPNLHFCEFCSSVARSKAEQTCTFGERGTGSALHVAGYQLAEFELMISF